MNEIAPARPIPADVADAYFSQIDSFEADRARLEDRFKRAGWYLSAGLFVCLAVAVAAPYVRPTHTVEWRVLTVDKSTGEVADLRTLQEAPKDIGQEEARYFTARYIEARENYIPEEAAENAHVVALMSLPTIQRAYFAQVNGTNPNSPQAQLGVHGFIRARIHSVAVLSETAQHQGIAQAHVTLERNKADASDPVYTNVIITVAYEWRPDAKMTPPDRDQNPLGFLVREYRVDPETP